MRQIARLRLGLPETTMTHPTCTLAALLNFIDIQSTRERASSKFDAGCLFKKKGIFTNSEGDTLLAESAEINGYVLLRNEFKATGRVSLSGATIDGDLSCDKRRHTLDHLGNESNSC